MYDAVVRGGTVVTSAGPTLADVAIEDGRITGVGPELAGGREEIDAQGLHVFPGLIDDHVHFNEPGHADWEGAATGSRALAAGGGTLFFDMPLNSIPCTINAVEFQRKREALQQASVTDFALWGGLTPASVSHLSELAECGVIGFKAFMANSGLTEFPRADDLTLYEGMREAARLDLTVAVHAESEELTAQLSQRMMGAGNVDVGDYLQSRPILAEVEAIHRAGLIAAETGARLQIVHVSSGKGVAAALQARARGANISIETCPHYLYFSQDDMETIGAAAKCAPPLRDAAEREDLWSHVLSGNVDVIGSDHSPAPLSMKQGPNFFKIWGGIAGVQSTLAVLITEGHFNRGLPLDTIAHFVACRPAELFRLSNKGTLAVGNDADLSVIDLAGSHRLRADDLFQRHKISPYIGSTFRGIVRRTMLRGRPIFESGKMIRSEGQLVRPSHGHAKSRTHS